MKCKPSCAEIAEHLDYDPGTGIFTRKKVCRAQLRQHLGVARGYTNSNGYVLISVNRGRFRAHQLAWLLMTGEWPTSDIDHINADRADNRWANLRAASRSQNLQNQRMRTNNTSGVKGVSFDSARQKWCAAISVNRHGIHLGRFDTLEEAAAVRVSAARRYFGEFAREPSA